MPIEHRKHTVVAAESGRVDLIVRTLTGKSRSHVRGMCVHGCVSINGAKANEPAASVKEGDVIDVQFDPQRHYREEWRSKFQSKAFSLVFEDDYLIVVDKQAGLLTVPTEAQERRTLVDEVSRYLGGRNRALVVHRLDRETSGLLVLAKRTDIARALQDQLRLRAPQREYLALVAGCMTEKSGTFESYLATSKRLSQYSVDDPDAGEHAVTHFRVEQSFADTTLVRVKLDTGRRNQIRVHLAEDEHPVIGDRRYRPQLSQHPDWPHTRLALHACILGFQHPVTGEDLQFVSDIPRCFQIFIRHQRRAEKSSLQPERNETPAAPAPQSQSRIKRRNSDSSRRRR